MMNKETIKKFLRPDWRKAMIFFIFVIASVVVLYIPFKMSGFYLMCDPFPCSNLEIFIHWLTYNIGLDIFTIVLITDYLLSCLTISTYDKFRSKK